MEVARTLPSDLGSPSTARRFVRDALPAGVPDETLECVELLVSEVVTNAVLHAGTDIEVRLLVDDDEIRIEVADGAPGEVRIRSNPTDEPTGRGLRIVDRLAERWGVVGDGDGKTVWFTVPAATGAPSTGEPPSSVAR